MKTESEAPEPWTCLKQEYGPDLKIFKVRYDLLKNPRNGMATQRVVLESVDWVNIVAMTRENRILVVRQFRSGVDRFTIEIPGGMVDPGEESKQAAVRELEEETGYTGHNWKYLGSVEPNPAFHNNRCHHWLALDVEKTNHLNLDDGEDIVVEALTLRELRTEIEKGKLSHALALSALGRVFNLWEDHHIQCL